MIRNWYNQIPHPALKTKREPEFVFYVKTDVSPYWSGAVLYRKSGFGTAKGYKLRK